MSSPTRRPEPRSTGCCRAAPKTAARPDGRRSPARRPGRGGADRSQHRVRVAAGGVARGGGRPAVGGPRARRGRRRQDPSRRRPGDGGPAAGARGRGRRSASGRPVAWRWRRWPTGCGCRPCRRRRRSWTRSGGWRSTGSSRRGRFRAEATSGSRAMVDAWQRHRFFEGLARALIAVERPLLLILDNVQWCDQETLGVLDVLASACAAMHRSCWRGTLRDDDHDIRARRVDLAHAGDRRCSPRSPCSRSTSPTRPAWPRRWRRRRCADADAGLLHATTGGFPLYIVEAARGGPSAPAARCRPAISVRCSTPGSRI